MRVSKAIYRETNQIYQSACLIHMVTINIYITISSHIDNSYYSLPVEKATKSVKSLRSILLKKRKNKENAPALEDSFVEEQRKKLKEDIEYEDQLIKKRVLNCGSILNIPQHTKPTPTKFHAPILRTSQYIYIYCVYIFRLKERKEILFTSEELELKKIDAVRLELGKQYLHNKRTLQIVS